MGEPEKSVAVETVENVDSNKEIVEINGSDALLEARKKSPPNPRSSRMLSLYRICLVAFLCSTMNGYDGSLMSSIMVMDPFKKEFNSTIVGVKAGYISAMYQIGGVCTIPFIGPLMDTTGRRFGMFLGCFLVIIGTILQGTSAIHNSLPQYLGGRFLLGFGVSFAASAAPMYVVEISHPLYRGAMTGSYNCFYGIGSIISSCATRGSVRFATNEAWLIPTWIQMVCPALVCVFVFFLPESPRWLYTHGNPDKAKEILIKYHGEGDANNAFITLQLREFEEQLELNGTDKTVWDYRGLFKTRAHIYRLGCNLVYSCWGSAQFWRD
jgi:MFS family permease